MSSPIDSTAASSTASSGPERSSTNGYSTGIAGSPADDPDRWIVVTFEGDKDEVAAHVLDAVRQRLSEHGVRA